jgi:hypothetical protein
VTAVVNAGVSPSPPWLAWQTHDPNPDDCPRSLSLAPHEPGIIFLSLLAARVCVCCFIHRRPWSSRCFFGGAPVVLAGV